MDPSNDRSRVSGDGRMSPEMQPAVPVRRPRRAVLRTGFAVWAAACVIVGAYLMSAHLLTLPTPEASDTRLAQSALTDRRPDQRGRWLAVHALDMTCKCSLNVLEHLLTPVQTLRACVRLLRPGGIVFLYVPNYDSASRLLMGKDAHFIWPTHHLNYYTPATMRDLMSRNGLTTEFVATEGLDIQDYIWYRREVLNKPCDDLTEVADTLQFLANAGC